MSTEYSLLDLNQCAFAYDMAYKATALTNWAKGACARIYRLAGLYIEIHHLPALQMLIAKYNYAKLYIKDLINLYIFTIYSFNFDP